MPQYVMTSGVTMHNTNSHDFYISDIKSIFLYNFPMKTLHVEKRNNHHLLFMLNGFLKLKFEDKTLLARSDSVLFVNKDEVCEAILMEQSRSISVHFACVSDLSLNSFVFKTGNMEEIKNMFQKLHREWLGKGEAHLPGSLSILYNIWALLMQARTEHYVPKTRQNEIESAALHIRTHYADPALNISLLSGMCKMSPEYFRSLFKKIYMISPIKYINKVRIDTARELLSTGSYPISAIADITGFSDIYYFSKTFRKETGMSPSTYARSLSG